MLCISFILYVLFDHIRITVKIISGNKLISGKSYMIPVTVLEGTPADAVKWDGNIICGGSLKGVSLETVKTAPEYADPSGAIKNIKENAGIQW